MYAICKCTITTANTSWEKDHIPFVVQLGFFYHMRCFSLYDHMKLQMQIFLKVVFFITHTYYAFVFWKFIPVLGCLNIHALFKLQYFIKLNCLNYFLFIILALAPLGGTVGRSHNNWCKILTSVIRCLEWLLVELIAIDVNPLLP